jgi:predicted Zn-dependent protease
MKQGLRTFLMAACLGASALSLAGCETNTATGRNIFTTGGIESDQQIGAEQHPKVVREFGGVYDDPNISSYVALVASRMSAASELPRIPWRFTVLNSEELNAFALPGGYVYVTRGLLALCENEAELAGVLGHEIGHVTARHSAERQGRATLVGIAGIAAALLGGGQAADAATQLGMANFVQHYSQEQEFEADTLGSRYLSRTGYQVKAMADFLSKMRDYSILQNKVAGRPANAVDQADFLASHPRTIDRVEQASEAAARTSGSGSALNRDAYLQAIQGMTFGDDASQGFIRGRAFIHPQLMFRFEAPEGFRLVNRPDAVLAIGPNGAMASFGMEGKPQSGSAIDYLRRAWGQQAQLQNVEQITVNGMDGATATARGKSSSGVVDVRFIVIKQSDERIYKFLFATPPSATAQLAEPLRRMTYSLRPISTQEAAAVKPWRIQIHRVTAGDSVASLSARMAMPDYKEDWFRTLNGVKTGEQLQTGQLVKLVAETR